MNLLEIKAKKAHGDVALAGDVIGLTGEAARLALHRPKSKYHDMVLSALETIINNRESLKKNYMVL